MGPLKGSLHFTYTPGMVKGPVYVKIGPVTMPWLPAESKVTGTLKLADKNRQQINCIGLNVPLMESTTPIHDMPLRDAPVNVGTDPITSCSSPDAHIKNFHHSKVGDKVTLSGDLDEDVSTFSLKLDARIAVGWFPIPIDLDVPVVFHPGFVKGPFQITATNSTTSQWGNQPMEGADLAGTLTGSDGHGGELFCLKMDLPIGQDKVFV